MKQKADRPFLPPLLEDHLLFRLEFIRPGDLPAIQNTVPSPLIDGWREADVISALNEAFRVAFYHAATQEVTPAPSDKKDWANAVELHVIELLRLLEYTDDLEWFADQRKYISLRYGHWTTGRMLLENVARFLSKSMEPSIEDPYAKAGMPLAFRIAWQALARPPYRDQDDILLDKAEDFRISRNSPASRRGIVPYGCYGSARITPRHATNDRCAIFRGRVDQACTKNKLSQKLSEHPFCKTNENILLVLPDSAQN
jgi:hypothetical protein